MVISGFVFVSLLYPPHNKVVGGYIDFTPSVRPSVRPPRIPCPRCSAYCFGWIHFIFIRRYQATSDVSRVIFLKIVKIWIFGIFLNLQLWLCRVLTWNLVWITSMGNHGVAGGISERRRSSCSSFISLFLPPHSLSMYIYICIWALNIMRQITDIGSVYCIRYPVFIYLPFITNKHGSQVHLSTTRVVNGCHLSHMVMSISPHFNVYACFININSVSLYLGTRFMLIIQFSFY